MVANELIGNCNVFTLSTADPGVIPKFALKRRRQSYVKFFMSNLGEYAPYRNYDIPVIIKNCIHLWPDIKSALPDDLEEREPRHRTFYPEHLDKIEEDIRLLLVVSNKIGKLEVREGVLRASRSTRQSCIFRAASSLPARGGAAITMTSQHHRPLILHLGCNWMRGWTHLN